MLGMKYPAYLSSFIDLLFMFYTRLMMCSVITYICCGMSIVTWNPMSFGLCVVMQCKLSLNIHDSEGILISSHVRILGRNIIITLNPSSCPKYGFAIWGRVWHIWLTRLVHGSCWTFLAILTLAWLSSSLLKRYQIEFRNTQVWLMHFEVWLNSTCLLPCG